MSTTVIYSELSGQTVDNQGLGAIPAHLPEAGLRRPGRWHRVRSARPSLRPEAALLMIPYDE
jgi:hypothetical protein